MLVRTTGRGQVEWGIVVLCVSMVGGAMVAVVGDLAVCGRVQITVAVVACVGGPGVGRGA